MHNPVPHKLHTRVATSCSPTLAEKLKVQLVY
jgi:hypothetical protein